MYSKALHAKRLPHTVCTFAGRLKEALQQWLLSTRRAV
jgi:hypothetical protein